MRSIRDPGAYSQVIFHGEGKTKAQRATKPALANVLAPAFLDVIHTPKNEYSFQIA